MAAIYYHTSVNASGAAAASREVQVGRFSPTVNVNLNVALSGQADLMFVAPTYTFATPVLGGQLSATLAGVYGRNSASVAGTLTATAGPVVTTRTGTAGHDLELVESFCGSLFGRKFCGSPNLIDNRVERIVHVVWGALVADRQMLLTGYPFAHAGQDARLADAGLAREQRDLAFARACVPPSLYKQRDLGLTSDEHTGRDRVVSADKALAAFKTSQPETKARVRAAKR